MKTFIINGKARSGKDEFVSLFNKIKNDNSVINWSSVDKYKEIMKKYYGWNGDKDYKSRMLMKCLKDLGLDYNPNMSIDDFLDKVCDVAIMDYAFVHIRRIDRINYFKKKLSEIYDNMEIIKILIRRNDVISSEGDMFKNIDFNPDEYDIIVDNNSDSLEVYEKQVEEIIKKYNL